MSSSVSKVASFSDFELTEARSALTALEEKNKRLADALVTAKQQLISMQQVVDQIAAPPAVLAMVQGVDEAAGEAQVYYGGKPMRLAIAPELDRRALKVGQLCRVSDQMVVVAAAGRPEGGELVTVQEVLDQDHVLVQSGPMATQAVRVGAALAGIKLGVGDSLLADLGAAIAYQHLVRADVEQLLTPEIPRVTYDHIGGLADQIEQVRDAVELPFAHPELYRTYGLRPPKGILLYGPPGCGKTLIAKAIATSLGGSDGAFFLSIKGPELLSKFVGETERHIRAIFARARALAQRDHPVVVFFDEMEALFRTRGSGVSSDVETMIVPQLLAEIDGVESLDNVVVIGASNREDMIDPAVLRAGRLDVHVRVDRPKRAGAAQILAIHLGEDVPLDAQLVVEAGGVGKARQLLLERIVDWLWQRDAQRAVYKLSYGSGASGLVYVSDVASGAMLAGIIERAKKHAIKDHLGQRGRSGLNWGHCLRALKEEIAETAALAAASDPAEWSRNQGYRGDTVVAVSPVCHC